MAEEFAFEQRFDDSGAVEDDILAFDAAAGVERAGDEILAGAGSPLNERGTIVRGDAADTGEELGHARAAADEAFEFGVVAGGLTAFCFGNEAADALAKDGQADGFFQIVGGAAADGLDCGLRCVVGGHEDDVGGGRDRHDAVEDVEAGHLGHDEVGKDQLRAELLDESQRLAGAGGAVDGDAVASQGSGEQLQTAGIVVQDDDGDGHNPARSMALGRSSCHRSSLVKGSADAG